MNTIFNISSLLSVIAMSLLLTGCFGSSNNSGTTNNGGGTTGTTTPQTSIATALALQSSDSESGSLNAVMDVTNDISKLFGNPDDAPIEIQAGDTVKSIFNKASY